MPEWLPLIGVALILMGLMSMAWVAGGLAGEYRGLGMFCGGVILLIASVVEVFRMRR
jgi:hypothetical protein